mmetsp:Transcript_57517/g.178636  ORF Transcript_57517/g.178636 Transcript_57517/m.178636 type:complete len:217 (+) Transcript_57517:843-1493(+)
MCADCILAIFSIRRPVPQHSAGRPRKRGWSSKRRRSLRRSSSRLTFLSMAFWDRLTIQWKPRVSLTSDGRAIVAFSTTSDDSATAASSHFVMTPSVRAPLGSYSRASLMTSAFPKSDIAGKTQRMIISCGLTYSRTNSTVTSWMSAMRSALWVTPGRSMSESCGPELRTTLMWMGCDEMKESPQACFSVSARMRSWTLSSGQRSASSKFPSIVAMA